MKANVAATILERNIKNIVQAEAIKGSTPKNTNVGKMTKPPPNPEIFARVPIKKLAMMIYRDFLGVN